MQTTNLAMLQFQQNAAQLKLPLYQRWYKWTTDHCDRLLDDALRTGSDKGTNNHYVGTITTVSPHPSEGGWPNPLTVVDGQQRLATLSLLLEAIAQIMPGAEAPEGFAPDQIRARFLLDPWQPATSATSSS